MKQYKHADRIKLAMRMLGALYHKHQVYKVLMDTYGISARTCQKYVSAAREELRAMAGRDLAEAKGESLEFYKAIIQDPEAEPEMRLRARMRMDKILGLEAPQQINQFVSGKVQTVKVEYSDESWMHQRFDLTTEPNGN